ncbi:hypothetical protein RGQ13_12415 [Thalassotalea psychrophila]|uniref:Uncharacterized protein n=1 Tax=Thalassotalea psychrophila TaxID=3065647 RepID=A0ABY9TRI2_9GAMM|nr:hypothetical protein RGQ13_12415 [Colwelliaceae bacterium SQ149]
MITRSQITFYRTVASIIVATPLIIEISFQWQILYALLYFPLASLILAMVAKYIDYKLMAALLLQEKQQILSNKVLPLQQPAGQLHKCAA